MSSLLQNIKSYIKGDLFIWALVALLALFSFMPVYSASTNLVYVAGNGTTIGILIKHAVLLLMGFTIMFFIHRTPYRYFSGVSVVMIPIVIVLLIVTLAQGTTIGGANAARWIRIPIIGVGFQTSTLAGLVIMVYTARYLAKRKDDIIDFKESLLRLWTPIALVLMFILPANFSTTAIVFMMVLMLCFVGGYPIKYLAGIIGAGIVILLLFVLTAKAFPGLMPNRVDTWMSRIESFSDDDSKEGYQVENAKIAIATGGLTGKGPGKSVQKNFLPQSSSDFIFAIIVEEYGLFGAGLVLLVYFVLTFRLYVAAKKAGTVFGKLLIVGVGFPIVFQAVINMMVATNLGPVTGQTLPLISSGGTSIWMTCLAVGMVLSVTASANVTEEQLATESEDPLEKLYHTEEIEEA
ncbi:FtsW/RodA/SpoVE family cell cycle protein [Wenyingzhuangia marina]|uniref:Probable peptidoglycan glycosyltransferase FtsW n=1 Tax=Wenyingzhuangia marina TaxID=1195760 RepID=A0A1M5SG44_9FLAO|nr:FtsW/RodA/SpoVE family cell cycle protein [Wenyingzhuangia marina]GGF62090.1 cell division protein FtsW [Wenyingzhuangia marina]SHH37461.1 cell division protein FtsW [Wenyingzhuangia marina]